MYPNSEFPKGRPKGNGMGAGSESNENNNIGFRRFQPLSSQSNNDNHQGLFTTSNKSTNETSGKNFGFKPFTKSPQKQFSPRHNEPRNYNSSNQLTRQSSKTPVVGRDARQENARSASNDIMDRFLDDSLKMQNRSLSKDTESDLESESSGNDKVSLNSKNTRRSKESNNDAFDLDLIEGSASCSIHESELDEDNCDVVSINNKESVNLFTISHAELTSFCTVQQKQAVKDAEFIYVPVSPGNQYAPYQNMPKYKAIVKMLNVKGKFGILSPLENQLITTDDVKFQTTNLLNFNEFECIVHKGCTVEFSCFNHLVIVFVADTNGVVLQDSGSLSQTDKWLPGIVVSVVKSNFFVRPMTVLKDTSRGTDVYVPNSKMPSDALPLQKYDEVRLLFREGNGKGKLMINKVVVTRYTGRSLRVLLDYLHKTLERLKTDGSLFIQLISLSYMFNYFTKLRFNSEQSQAYFLLHYMRFLILSVKERNSFDDFCAIPFQELVLSANFNSNGRFMKFLSSSRINESFKCRISNEVASIFDTVTEFLLTSSKFDQSLLKRVYPFVCLINKFETSPRVQDWISKMLQFCITGKEIFCNDENWRELRLIPNSCEIWDALMENNDNLSKIVLGHGYENEEEYMEVYFRLLRAECFSPIQNGIKNFCTDKFDPRDMNVYYNVSVRGYNINNSELAFAISFSSVKRIKDWKFCSNLMFGNLLCLSLSGTFKNDLIWATVADRDIDLLNRNQMIVIHLCSAFNSLNSGEILFKLIENSGNMTMVESPSYFLSFQPVLETLQNFDIKSFPMKREIVFCQPDEAPDYLKSSDSIDASSIFSASSQSVSYDQLLQKLTSEDSILDESQANAIHHALSHRLAIVQGPPGCGKTFIGAKLAQIILSCLDENAGPILVLSYKNHALDEFLKHIIKIVGIREIVRVGSRSRDSALEKCNLKFLEKNERPVTLKEARLDIKRQIEDKIKELRDEVSELYSKTKLTKKSFAQSLSEEQLQSFFLGANYGSEIKFSIAKNVSISRANAKTYVGTMIRKYGGLQCFFALEKHFNKGSEEENITKLFAFLINAWLPKKETMASLKIFHTAFVKEIEKIKEKSKQLEEVDDTTDEWDEKAVENMMQSRVEAFSGLSTLNHNSENRIIWGDPTIDKRNILILNELPAKLEVNHSILTVDNMWSLSEAQKVHFLFSLIKTQYDKESINFNRILKELEMLAQLKNQIQTSQRAEMLAKKKVVGMTIVGACIHQKLIAELKPPVVIVEEAAEILEPKLLATLTPHLQHLIMIGDHMQLRPQIDTYPLRIKYQFDVSMMERLIKSGYPFASLKRQNRMRCEFSALLKDIYPDLMDNLNIVQYHKPLDCIAESMYFWTHRVEEVSGRSYKNPEEVSRIEALVEFLLLQDISPSNITVLSSYQGQTHEIRKAIGRHRVSINTIDMYQGDENEYVIVSLVRSVKALRKKNPIGFLAELNRRCVAQSRAKCGLYFVGNEETLSLNKHWAKLIAGMKEQSCVGPSLPVQCPKHKELSRHDVSSTEELEKLVRKPHKLCCQPCGNEMPCGITEHACKEKCQSLHQHERCCQQVLMTFSKCGHTRMKACYQSESDFICEEKINFVLRRCGHNIVKLCHEDELYLKCVEKVEFNHQKCGHKDVKECHENKFDKQCLAVCERIMDCGEHRCKGEVCGVYHSHSKCSELIKYEFPSCGHEAKRRKKCSEPITDKCSLVENISCGYGHYVAKKCGEPAAACQFPCTKLRDCGHQCSHLCGDDCQKDICMICEEANKIKILKAKEDLEAKTQQVLLEIKMQDEFSINEIEKNSAEYMSVEDLVVKYVKPEHSWYPSVTKIEKISNMKLLKMFNEALLQAKDHYCAYKFHGTSEDGVKGISKDGFRLPSKVGMFGRGIYFATDSSKSAQEIYTKRSNKLLVCKVLLGKSKNVASANNTLTLESIRREGCDSVFAPRNTKGTGGVLNDEFVIFDPKQALPVYIVSYSTTSLANVNLNVRASKSYFKIEKLQPSRYLDLKNPYAALCQYAEGHFYKMLNRMNVSSSTHKIREIHIVENGLLEDSFNRKMQEFKNANIPDKPILAFHGTAVENIDNILKTNLQVSYAKRQAYGRGIYFSEFPDVSLGYGSGLILCQLLPGNEYTDSTSSNIPPGYNCKLVSPNASLQNSSQMVIVENSDQILPKFVYYL